MPELIETVDDLIVRLMGMEEDLIRVNGEEIIDIQTEKDELDRFIINLITD